MAESDQTCQKPKCYDPAEKTYEGPHGNDVEVCEKHYYKLVTRGRMEHSPLGTGTDITGGSGPTITRDDSTGHYRPDVFGDENPIIE